jgi:surface protein
MKPTFILKVYNPEFYQAQGNEPMPIVLTHTEAWDLKSVEGLDPSFLGLEAETTSDKYGQLNIQTTADNRTVSFNLALAPEKVEDALVYFSRYLISGCYATLTTAENSKLWLPVRIANYEFNRWSNGVEVTVNLTCLDRFWHYDADTVTSNSFTLLSDAPTKPVIWANYTAAESAMTITIAHSYKEYVYNYRTGIQVMERTTTSKKVYNLTTAIASGDEVSIVYDGNGEDMSVTYGGNKYYPGINISATTWDGLLLPGENTIEISGITGAEYRIQTLPVYATYPKDLVATVDGTVLSRNLIAENIKKDVSILGITGTYDGEHYDTYTGIVDVTPADYVQTLETANKVVKTDITVQAKEGGAGTNKPLTTDDFMMDIVSLDLSNPEYWAGKTSFERYFTSLHNLKTITTPSKFYWKQTWGSNITSFMGAFYGCSKLEKINMNRCDVSNVTDMSYMFHGCTSLVDIDATLWHTASLKDTSYMFARCAALESIDMHYCNTPELTTMSGMFYGCNKLASLNISNFDTSKVTSMGGLFSICSSLTDLYLGNFNTANVTNMANMFYSCASLTNITFPATFAENDAITSLDFSSCPLAPSTVYNLISALTTKTSASLKIKTDVWAAATALYPSLATTLEEKGWSITEV